MLPEEVAQRARLTTAGFGGCTVNPVLREKAEEFSQALAKGYKYYPNYLAPV